MGKEKQKQSPTKKDQLVSTAVRLFSRFGIKRVTIEEICREAKVSKMTFYKHFGNKVELVSKIRDDWVHEGFAKFDEIDRQDIPFPEKIEQMTRWRLEYGRRLNAEFIRELVSNDDLLAEFKSLYLRNIRKAQNRGEIRADIEPEFLWLVVEKTNDIFKEGRWKQVLKDHIELQQQIRTLIWYGLLTREEKQS